MTLRRQVAALPLRRAPGGLLEFLLVTTRATGRWIIPKGWPSRRLRDCRAAAREAWQEAGVRGRITPLAVGTYRYAKAEFGPQIIEVSVFVLEVLEVHDKWREQNQRRREWFEANEAIHQIGEPELAELMKNMLANPVLFKRIGKS